MTISRQLPLHLLLAGCFFCCDVVAALPASPPTLHQAEHPTTFRHTDHSTLFGIGAAHQLDTYLSPLAYRGPQVHLLHETRRTTHLLDSCISFQTLLQADLADTHSPAENANDLSGYVHFDAAWHYLLVGAATSSYLRAPRATSMAPAVPDSPLTSLAPQSAFRHSPTEAAPFRVLLGPQIGATLGGLYNTRNGNNPAQATAAIRLSLSAAALYSFRLWRQPVTLRDQADIPLLGAMFSPAYGQSYYELFSLGHRDHNIRLTTPFNAPSLRNQLTVDLPLRRYTLRLGYLADIRQSHVNSIRHHTYSHSFLLGWVHHLSIERPPRHPAHPQ